ncbi:MAG: alanine racemase [Bacteroidota bacterium]
MRATVAVINSENLKHNIAELRKFTPNSKAIAIVKANAYGHGTVGISKLLRKEKIHFLGIAFPEEGIVIRESGDNEPIIVLVPALPDEVDIFCKYNLQPVASSIEFIEALSEEAVKQNVQIKAHLFIGTGMNREGVQPSECVAFMQKCLTLPNIEMEGVCTHFASSTSDANFLHRQLKLFNDTIKELNQAGFTFKYTHSANSGAIANHPDSHFNLTRPGLWLYGYAPADYLKDTVNLKPVLTLKSKVILSRTIRKGETVSYDRLYTANKPTNIVTIPIGYGDGYFKNLTGKGECLINGKRYPIAGAICMDECMADVGNDTINVGDEVILLGSQENETITAEEIAQKAGTIIWEVLTSVAARIPRVYE